MKVLNFYAERCTGCRECAMACSLVKFGECNPRKSAVTVIRDEFKRYEYAVFCLQCDEPVCEDVCHQNAYTVEDGVVKHDDDRCIHCRLCAAMCPYSAITVHGKDIVKCDLCDGDPTCVKYCATNALVYEEETKEMALKRKEMVERILGTPQ